MLPVYASAPLLFLLLCLTVARLAAASETRGSFSSTPGYASAHPSALGDPPLLIFGKRQDASVTAAAGSPAPTVAAGIWESATGAVTVAPLATAAGTAPTLTSNVVVSGAATSATATAAEALATPALTAPAADGVSATSPPATDGASALETSLSLSGSQPAANTSSSAPLTVSNGTSIANATLPLNASASESSSANARSSPANSTVSATAAVTSLRADPESAPLSTPVAYKTFVASPIYLSQAVGDALADYARSAGFQSVGWAWNLPGTAIPGGPASAPGSAASIAAVAPPLPPGVKLDPNAPAAQSAALSQAQTAAAPAAVLTPAAAAESDATQSTPDSAVSVNPADQAQQGADPNGASVQAVPHSASAQQNSPEQAAAQQAVPQGQPQTSGQVATGAGIVDSSGILSSDSSPSSGSLASSAAAANGAYDADAGSQAAQEPSTPAAGSDTAAQSDMLTSQTQTQASAANAFGEPSLDKWPDTFVPGMGSFLGYGSESEGAPDTATTSTDGNTESGGASNLQQQPQQQQQGAQPQGDQAAPASDAEAAPASDAAGSAMTVLNIGVSQPSDPSDPSSPPVVQYRPLPAQLIPISELPEGAIPLADVNPEILAQMLGLDGAPATVTQVTGKSQAQAGADEPATENAGSSPISTGSSSSSDQGQAESGSSADGVGSTSGEPGDPPSDSSSADSSTDSSTAGLASPHFPIVPPIASSGDGSNTTQPESAPEGADVSMVEAGTGAGSNSEALPAQSDSAEVPRVGISLGDGSEASLFDIHSVALLVPSSLRGRAEADAANATDADTAGSGGTEGADASAWAGSDGVPSDSTVGATNATAAGASATNSTASASANGTSPSNLTGNSTSTVVANSTLGLNASVPAGLSTNASAVSPLAWLESNVNLYQGVLASNDSDLAFVNDPIAPSGSPKVLRVSYPKGSYALQNPMGGVNFFSQPFIADGLGSSRNGTTPYEAVTNSSNATSAVSRGQLMLTYSVYFPHDFDFVNGGKLPGLYSSIATPGPNGSMVANTDGCIGANKPDQDKSCWSVRVMWRAGGIGEVYGYIPTKLPGGGDLCAKQAKPDDPPMPDSTICNDDGGVSFGRGGFTFYPGQWTQLSLYVQVNSPAAANGVLSLFVNGSPTAAVSKGGIALRRDDANAPVSGKAPAAVTWVDKIFFTSFFGGFTPADAAAKDSFSYFKGISFFAANAYGSSAAAGNSAGATSAAASSQRVSFASLLVVPLSLYFLLL